MPPESKKRMTTDWGSSGASRTDSPPGASSLRTPNRVTGTVATSRSATSTPAALRPDHHGPLEHPGRPAGVPGRHHRRPLLHGGAVGHGQAYRQLRGDVDVGQTGHAEAAEEVAGPRDSHTIEELTMAPCSTVLNG